MNTLIDETSRPSLRSRIGRLLSQSTCVDIAVGDIRLRSLDLAEHETSGVQRMRILLGRLEVTALAELGADDADTRQLNALLAFLGSGRVEVRSAGVGAWAPDFSVYRGSSDGDACLIGAHWFREPVVSTGPTFTALLTSADDVARALSRFDALWKRSHDVMEPVMSAIARRQSFEAG